MRCEVLLAQPLPCWPLLFGPCVPALWHLFPLPEMFSEGTVFAKPLLFHLSQDFCLNPFPG